jgi:hypothetical protein
MAVSPPTTCCGPRPFRVSSQIPVNPGLARGSQVCYARGLMPVPRAIIARFQHFLYEFARRPGLPALPSGQMIRTGSVLNPFPFTRGRALIITEVTHDEPIIVDRSHSVPSGRPAPLWLSLVWLRTVGFRWDSGPCPSRADSHRSILNSAALGASRAP